MKQTTHKHRNIFKRENVEVNTDTRISFHSEMKLGFFVVYLWNSFLFGPGVLHRKFFLKIFCARTVRSLKE